MGIPDQLDHPDFLAAVDRLVAACRAYGKPAGVLAERSKPPRHGGRGLSRLRLRADMPQSWRDGLARMRAGEDQ